VLTYLLRRVLLAIPVLIGVSFLSFWVVASNINPLWPLLVFGGNTTSTKEAIAEITKRAHLEDPLLERYWLWLKGLFSGGGLGRSILTNNPIWPPVWQALLHTGQLIGASLVVVTLCSLAIGTLAARRPGSATDLLLRVFAYFTWSIPAFVLALGLPEIFVRAGSTWGVHPFHLSGVAGPQSGHGFHYALEWIRYMTLPVLAVSLTFIGAYSRYIRSSMLVALHAPYAVVARAKGLPERRVTIHHALRTSLIPFVTVLTLDFGSVFGAALVADVVFQQHGMGALLLAALNPGDPFQLEALLTVTAVVVVVFSLLADVVYSWLDPRIRLA